MRSRILDIYARYSEYIHRLVPLQVEDAYLKIVIYFADGSNLRVTEEWEEDVLTRYSYYWLAPDNQLKIGWNNASHHAKLDSFPHHKHVGQQTSLQPSGETCLEEVMQVIIPQLPPLGIR
ncbi:MAG TPA: DUF6516 family protein [Anaerolineae bacterium]|nr:DUF6516 family protein [Anaerolineae bacterium]